MPRPKLTPEQVAEIRASAESGKSLAERHGISQASISRIRGGEAAAEKAREHRRERYQHDEEARKRAIEATLRWRSKPENAETVREYSREYRRERRRLDPEFKNRDVEAAKRWYAEAMNVEKVREKRRERHGAALAPLAYERTPEAAR